jgi:hypothetical protein
MTGSAIRFFWVAAVHPRATLLGAIGGVATLSLPLWYSPVAIQDALLPVLIAQMFLASTGFKAQANRGHFDALLVAGRWLPMVAWSHWIVSILPGVGLWVAIGASEFVIFRDASGFAFSRNGLLALVVASTLPWALSLALPRFSGAIVCLLGTLAVAVCPGGLVWLALVPHSVASANWSNAVGVAAGTLMAPVLLLGTTRHGAPSTPVLLLDAFVLILALAAGAAYVASRDNALRES